MHNRGQKINSAQLLIGKEQQRSKYWKKTIPIDILMIKIRVIRTIILCILHVVVSSGWTVRIRPPRKLAHATYFGQAC